jgi:hypothetical protein
MAKKISSSDLFEQEDLFKGVRDSASKTLAVFNELQAELKATAQGLKTELTANTQASTAQLKQFSAASEQANKLMQQAVQIEKLKAQADQQKIKAEQEIVKLQKMQAQETARLAKEQEKAAKLAAQESSAYAQLSKELNNARKAYKDLAVTNQENTTEGKKLLATITQLDAQLKEVDATVGQHQRNVGNYGEALKGVENIGEQLVNGLKNLDAKFEDVYGELQPLTTRLGEAEDRLYELALAGKQTSQEYQELLQKVSNYRRTQIETDMVVDAAATRLDQKLGGALQGVVSAFAGAQGAMALFGVDGEKMQETLLKVQGALALLEGIKGVREAQSSFKALTQDVTTAFSKLRLFTSAQNTQNVAVNAGGGAFTKMGTSAKAALNGIRGGIAATGIGLLVVALGTIVAYWDDIKEAVSGVSAEQKKYNKQLDKDLEAQQFKGKMLDAQENTLRLQGKTEKEIIQYKIDQIDGEIAIAEKKLKTAEISAKLEYDAAVRNRGYAEAYFRIIFEGIMFTLRATAAPIDALLETANAVGEALGVGKLTTSNINKEITKLTTTGADFFAGLLFDPAETKKNSDKLINDQKLAIAQMKGDRDGLKMQLKQGDKNAGKDSIKTAEETAQTQIDIQRRLEDEKMAARDESRKKDLDALALDYKRKLEDAKVELKDDKEKATKIAALEKQYQENIRKGIFDINQKWDKIELEQAE